MKPIFKQNILTAELILLLISNIVLLNLPLTNILGYEYSALNGILITLLSGLLAISLLKKRGGERTLPAFLKELFLSLLPVILLPLIMSLIASLFVKNCSFVQGVFYYLVLAVPALVVGSSLGIICFLLSSRFSYLNLVILYLAILFLPVLYIYLNPQIYFYNPIIGYFPGTIYDEALKIDFKLVSYRILNVLYFSSAAYAALKLIWKNPGRTYKAGFCAAMFLIAVVFILSGDSLGYSTTKSGIIKELGGHVTSEHFEIYYDKKIDPRSVRNIILHNEYYYEQISEQLKVRPSKKVTTFLFFDSAQKKKLMGSANADVAKPWLYQLYINYGNYEQTLQHEIVHCISSEFGVTPFKVPHGFNPSLLEGLAVALEDDYDGHTIHYMASLAYKNNFNFPIDRLFEGFNFFSGLSSISYIYSGSFVKFLIDKYGVEKIKEIYRGGGDYAPVYGKPLSSLIGEYYSFISAFRPEGSADEALYYFGRNSIFKKVCARFLAENIELAWGLYNSGQNREAEMLFQKLLHYSESYQALLGYITSLKKAEKEKRALEVLQENLDKYNKTSYYYNLELMTADLFAINKDYSKAASIYERLSKEKASREYGYLSRLRLILVNDTSLVRRYLKGSDFDKYAILKGMNKDSVSYSTLPVLAGLSERLQENYADFMKQWLNRLNVTDFPSSYAAFKLSGYALKNMEFQDSRSLAAMALSYKGDSEYQEVMRLWLKKLNWFINFGEITLSGAKWE